MKVHALPLKRSANIMPAILVRRGRRCSVRQVFNRAKRFFDYVRATLGAMDLARVDQNLIDTYARWLRADRRRLPNVNAQLLEVIVDLYAFRDHLPSGGLRFEPWHGRSPYVVAG
jgi:hypothetical protein